MSRRKRFKEKVGDVTITVGLTGLAVLLSLGDAAITAFLRFPSHRTTIGQAYDRAIRLQPKSIGEYLAELKEISGRNFYLTLRRLEERGLVKRTPKGPKLTSLGLRFTENVKNKIVHFDNWDNKWRLITFDIPEKQRHDRDWLRYVLNSHNYKPLHKSVFVGKFPLPDWVYKDIRDKGLIKYTRLLTVGEIDEEKYLL
ncbi:MAG: hypothetical protein HY378_01295 [Candidatus Brennerbacteria bacterium]|nr:hypothetical protein [Candidatus Brennerbacteria bacterium]